MRIVVRNLVYIVILLTLSTSCGFLTKTVRPNNNVADNNQTDNNAADIKEIMANALTQLGLGEVNKAEVYVDQLISRNPRHEVALDLRKQIEMDPDEYFQQFGWYKKCRYRVQGVDSLSRIARNYLDDKHKFYSLAKLNNINVPQNLRRGQIIQLPSADCSNIPADSKRNEKKRVKPKEPIKPAKVKPVPVPKIPEAKKLTLEYYLGKAAEKERLDQLKEALDFVAVASKKYQKNKQLIALEKSLSDQMDARRYLKLGDELQATKQPMKAIEYYQRARMLYEGASEHSQVPSRISDELSVLSFYIDKLALQISQQADEYSQQAEKFQQAGEARDIASIKDLKDLELSLRFYEKAIALSPGRLPLQSAQKRVREQLVEHYHRLALKRYSVKTLPALEQAIVIWDKLLRLSPGYKQATIKQNKAIKLRDAIKAKSPTKKDE